VLRYDFWWAVLACFSISASFASSRPHIGHRIFCPFSFGGSTVLTPFPRETCPFMVPRRCGVVL